MGRFSPIVESFLGDQHLLLRSGKFHLHLLQWKSGRLDPQYSRGPSMDFGTNADWKSLVLTKQATYEGLPAFARYDRARFVLGVERGHLQAVGDRLGQVGIFDRDGELVCMAFAFRKDLALWMPDGTCFGPVGMLGHPPTVNALEKIGRALRAANQGEGGRA